MNFVLSDAAIVTQPTPNVGMSVEENLVLKFCMNYGLNVAAIVNLPPPPDVGMSAKGGRFMKHIHIRTWSRIRTFQKGDPDPVKKHPDSHHVAVLS